MSRKHFISRHIYLPANRIFIKSNGCKMSVEVTPPDMPATMCSYLTCENNVTFRVGPLVFIADMFFFFDLLISTTRINHKL